MTEIKSELILGDCSEELPKINVKEKNMKQFG